MSVTLVTTPTPKTKVYEKEPKETDNDIVTTEAFSVRKVTATKDKDGTEWLQVKGKRKHKDKQGWIKLSELTEINPYEWQILNDTGSQYFYQFGDSVENTEPHNFVTTLWEQLKQYDSDNDKVLSVYELQKARSSEAGAKILSKFICKHFSEWDTNSKIRDFKTEVENIYKKGIEQETVKAEITALEEARDNKIALLEDKINNLCFWDKIQTGDLVPTSKRKQDYIDKHKPVRTSMLPKGTSKEEIRLAKEFDDLEKERTPRKFPTDSNVYHFHPIAFVEQMKMICATTPPWMEVALAEAKKAKFIRETLSPTSEMANKYHTYVGMPKATGSTAWCASFVNWCLNESGQKSVKSAGSQSILWNEGKLFKRINEPVYGCIVLLTNYVKSNGKQTSNGHVTFLYGIDSNDNLICLGGNQRDTIKFSRYKKKGVLATFEQYQKSEKGVVFVEQKFNGFFLPMDYFTSNSKEPDVVNMKKLNNELAGKAVKSDGKNEKTT